METKLELLINNQNKKIKKLTTLYNKIDKNLAISFTISNTIRRERAILKRLCVLYTKVAA